MAGNPRRSPRMVAGPCLLAGFTDAQCQIHRGLPFPMTVNTRTYLLRFFMVRVLHAATQANLRAPRASAFNDRPRLRFLHAMPTTTGDLDSVRVARTTQVRDSSRREARMRAVPMCPMISASRLAWKNRIGRLKKNDSSIIDIRLQCRSILVAASIPET